MEIIFIIAAFVGGAVLAVASPKVFTFIQTKIAATKAAAEEKAQLLTVAIKKDQTKADAAVLAYARTL